MGTLFNTFEQTPFIPYNIISFLAKSEKAEGLFKLLKYDDYNALSKPNLSMKEKMALVWKMEENQTNYSIFLTNRLEDEETRERTFMKLYKALNTPNNAQISVLCYEFDILCGDKISMVEYNGYPCNRLDVIESIIISTLNGTEVSSVGKLQFNRELSRNCSSRTGIGNNINTTGISIVMATMSSTLQDDKC